MAKDLGKKIITPLAMMPLTEWPPDELVRLKTKDIEWRGNYWNDSVKRFSDFATEFRDNSLWVHFGSQSWNEFCINYFKKPAEFINASIKMSESLDSGDWSWAELESKTEKYILKDSRQPDRVRQTSPETIAKAERARELREQGLTQSQIAEELGVPRSYVSALLNSNVSNTWYIVPCVTDINDESDRPAARGNLREYMIARLDRDAPEIAAKVRSGEISAHKGMIEAGIRKRKVNANWNDGASPNEIADVLMRKIPSEHLASVVAALTNQLVQ